MLEMSWITGILQLYSQVTDIFGKVIVKRINIRLFDLLALFHYILNLPCTKQKGERTGLVVRASDSRSGDPGSILGRVGVLFP